MGIVRDALRGATAGAAGTVALDITTYLDMAIRGRSSSGVPAKVAGSLTETAGIDLAPDGNSEAAENRKSGIGALMGDVVGLGVCPPRPCHWLARSWGWPRWPAAMCRRRSPARRIRAAGAPAAGLRT